jgi:hypothetical protein
MPAGSPIDDSEEQINAVAAAIDGAAISVERT